MTHELKCHVRLPWSLLKGSKQASLLPFLHLTSWNSAMMVGVPAAPTIIFLSLAKKMRVKGPSSAQKVGQKVKGFQISDDFGKLSTVPRCFPSRLLLHERRKPGALYSEGCLVLYVCTHSLQPCLTLCVPMDCGLQGSSVHWILQARILEWVTMPSSSGSSWPRDRTHISCVSCIVGRFFTTEPPQKPSSSLTWHHNMIHIGRA